MAEIQLVIENASLLEPEEVQLFTADHPFIFFLAKKIVEDRILPIFIGNVVRVNS